MSGAVFPSPLSTPSPPSEPPRKRLRTMSFSAGSQSLASKHSLRRTGSFLFLPDMQVAEDYNRLRATTSSDCSSFAPYTRSYARSVRPYKEHRDRRKSARTPSESKVIIRQPPLPVAVSPPQSPLPRPRTSSPLAPTRAILPARASFPRSKPEPNLYRLAIITRMRMSPEGQKILNMGPRLAVSILSATNELEKIVAARHRETDSDVPMTSADSMSITSWVVVPAEDWEMVDCRA